jgi:hypothetical protein
MPWLRQAAGRDAGPAVAPRMKHLPLALRATAFGAALLALGIPARAAQVYSSHDFDFEFGAWRAHLTRLVHPLTGSHAWVTYDGTSVVHPIWGGSGNFGELDVKGPAGRIQGVTIRLYDPQARRWNVSWANAGDGAIGVPPMTGGFSGGRGVFYDHESLRGRPIEARFVFSDIARHSFRFEQAFSPDDGKTWEVNWRATFTR